MSPRQVIQFSGLHDSKWKHLWALTTINDQTHWSDIILNSRLTEMKYDKGNLTTQNSSNQTWNKTAGPLILWQLLNEQRSPHGIRAFTCDTTQHICETAGPQPETSREAKVAAVLHVVCRLQDRHTSSCTALNVELWCFSASHLQACQTRDYINCQ